MIATDRVDSTQTILVWDLPVRVGHWLLAGGFAVSWLTGESEEWRLVHALAGGVVVGIALFRLLWGFIGSRHARFSGFVTGPIAAIDYLKSLLDPTPRHYSGHNPAGGWAIVLLLTLALLTGVTGWFGYQDIGGEWLKELHEGIASTLFALVAVHLAGVFVGSKVHGENLPRAMVTGRKLGSPGEAIVGTRPLVAIGLVVWTITVAWWLSR